MYNSKNFKYFKKRIGQANHFLITALIGLDAVKNGATKLESFDVAWNPKDIDSSVIRSRKYIINASLAWVVDNIDMYFRLCNKEPKLFGSNESKKIDSTKHSVYGKFKCVSKHHPNLPKNQKAFVDLLICWRNNMVHYDADNSLSKDTTTYFEKEVYNDESILKYHLDIEQMLSRFHEKDSPTFKETATMISMAINFVKSLDEDLLKELNKKQYCKHLLKIEYKMSKCEFLKNTNDNLDKLKKIKQYLFTHGITEDFLDDNAFSYILQLSHMSFKELERELLTP